MATQEQQSAVQPADGGMLVPPEEGAVPKPAVAAVAVEPEPGTNLADAETSHVEQLIRHGADVNAPDNNGWTPLHTAAYHGQEEIVKILLSSNANVNARNKNQETPLHLAAKWPQDRVVDALLTGGADVNARNRRGRTPAHIAALFNRHAILDRLLGAGGNVNALDEEQQTPLHLAVRPNTHVEPELVKTLIRRGADLEAKDTKGNLPLQHLPRVQDWLHWGAYEGKEVLLRVLLAKGGVKPDCFNDEGLTPLHLAVHANSPSMVAMLLQAGARVNTTTQLPCKAGGKEHLPFPFPGAPGTIAAGITISSQLKAYGSAKLLPGELTALHIAAERGSAEMVRLLVSAGAKVNSQGDKGMPPLHVAVWEGNTAAVVALLAAKASVALKSKAGGFTALHCACLSSRATPELLNLLLDNGGAAVLEERSQEGWTALQLACQSAPAPLVELLLQRGARATAKGKNGRTAADCAGKRIEILQLLHNATGGKVPLPANMSLPALPAPAPMLTHASGSPNGTSNGAIIQGGASSSASRAVSAMGQAAARLVGSSTSAGSNSGRGGSGLLPGTAAVLEPLESVEATLAALLADMGGALCALNANYGFGGSGCSVDAVGHCIKPLDKRVVLQCTLGCQTSFHLACWKAARELLKSGDRWPEFAGSLSETGRYPCLTPGCPGFVREQAICDGTAGQPGTTSKLYTMPQEVFDELPATGRPIAQVAGVAAENGPAQPALPAVPQSLQSLAPSLSLAQAMVQAAAALGSAVAANSRAIMNSPPPPVPQAMGAREACAIAAATIKDITEEDSDEEAGGSTSGRDGGSGAGPSTSSPTSSSAAAGAGPSTSNGAGPSGSRSGKQQGKRAGALVAKGGKGPSGGSGSSGRGSSSGAGGSGAQGGKGGTPLISNATAQEMLQQLQGLQQAVQAVQNAYAGAGVHSMGLGLLGSGAGGPATVGSITRDDDTQDVLPPREAVRTASGGSSGDDEGCSTSYSSQVESAPLLPPRRRNPSPHIKPQLHENGGQSQVSPQLATPPPSAPLAHAVQGVASAPLALAPLPVLQPHSTHVLQPVASSVEPARPQGGSSSKASASLTSSSSGTTKTVLQVEIGMTVKQAVTPLPVAGSSGAQAGAMQPKPAGSAPGSPVAAAAGVAAAASSCASSGGSSSASAAAASSPTGQYSRQLFPHLQQGAHRVTLSAGSSMPPPPAAVQPEDAAAAGPMGSACVVTSKEVRVMLANAAENRAAYVAAVEQSKQAAAARAAGSPAAGADAGAPGEDAVGGAATGNGAATAGTADALAVDPHSSAAAAPAGPEPMSTVAVTQEAPEQVASAAQLPAAAMPAVGPLPPLADVPDAGDLVLDALHAMEVGGGAADVSHGAALAVTQPHLLLESKDIPLLAATPGMLEAWLSAHVGTFGRLAAHRILAPQGAAVVAFDTPEAAAAAAGALRSRGQLLMAPLRVATLRDFPEDGAIAATVQQRAQTRSSQGDTAWMEAMVECWKKLQTLPPVVRHT